MKSSNGQKECLVIMTTACYERLKSTVSSNHESSFVIPEISFRIRKNEITVITKLPLNNTTSSFLIMLTHK